MFIMTNEIRNINCIINHGCTFILLSTTLIVMIVVVVTYVNNKLKMKKYNIVLKIGTIQSVYIVDLWRIE